MTDEPPSPDNPADIGAARAVAQAWFVRLADGDAGDAEHARFRAWLAAAPEHRAAWERTCRLWSRLDGLAPALQGRAAEVAAAAPLPAGPRLSRRRWLAGAVAAAAVAVAGGAWVRDNHLLADRRTATGERRAVTLADGSAVELGSASALSVEFTERQRKVVLHAGEAFFRVAADPVRPFVVAAGDGETRALGTAFNVRHGAAAIEVTVTEHAVAVSLGGGEAIAVGAGQQVRYADGRLGDVRAVDTAAALAWRQDRLVFHEAPLGEVVADLGRHRPGRIVITDAAVARIPVTGSFRTDRTDDALRTVAQTLPVDVTRVTDLLVFLGPR